MALDKKKLVVGLGIAAASVLTMGGTAAADHSHFVVITHPVTGVRTCQYLAHGTSEPAPNHPLHNLVHLGTPGGDDHGTDVDKGANQAARCDIARGN